MKESVECEVPRWIYRHRGLFVTPPLIYAFLSCHWEVENEWLIWPVAAFFVLLGVAIRVWAQQHIRFRLHEKRHLTTTGPYALTRNPLYIANTLICVGLTAASELFWMAPITLVWCAIVYSLVVRYEEGRVLRKYGRPFQQYMAAVPRWMPRSLKREGLELVTPWLPAAFAVELCCVLTLVPYLFKEWVEPWLRG